jgi:hypothetical protein
MKKKRQKQADVERGQNYFFTSKSTRDAPVNDLGCDDKKRRFVCDKKHFRLKFFFFFFFLYLDCKTKRRPTETKNQKNQKHQYAKNLFVIHTREFE